MIEIADHDIGPAVIIEVTDGTAAPAAVVVHAVGRRDIRKSEVPVIAEEPVGLAIIHEIDIGARLFMGSLLTGFTGKVRGKG